jgi:hypothetical protein
MFRSVLFPLHMVRKHKEYNVSISKVELKLTGFTLMDAHTLPTQGRAWVCVDFLQCVCATLSLEDKN